jgi:hypothetical protein
MNLVCPRNHPWELTSEPSNPGNQPRPWLCPVCGDLPTFGSRLGWEMQWLGCLLVLGGICLWMAVPVGVSLLLRLNQEQVRALVLVWTLVTGIPCLAYGLLRGRGWVLDVRRAATALGFASLEQVPEGRAKAVEGFPLYRKGSYCRALTWATGSFQSSEVVLADLQCGIPVSKGGTKDGSTFTVVLFTQPLRGLPDFEIEPTADQGNFWTRDLLQVLRLRRPPPLSDESFGQRYRLTAAEPDAVLRRLPRPSRDLLASHPGWAVQAHRGQLLICCPYKVCPARGRPVLLSLAWRIREMLREGGAEPADAAG